MNQQNFALTIDGMHCNACVRRVNAALSALDGVVVGAVEVGRASGTFDPSVTDAASIANAISNAGYATTPSPATNG